jgi:tripartite-type tricarboxylate transporter receptor subunit TctC
MLMRSPLPVRVLTTIALAMLAVVASAQEPYPTHAVRIIVPFPPGGPADALARLAGDRLGRALGQAFVIENRPGAGGNIGL